MSSNRVLAVDLDGTLLKSDLLVESFWSALAHRPVAALKGLRAKTKPELKARLAEAAEIDVALLPYDTAVLDEIHAHRAAGGRAALVTASHHDLAEAVAAHLGCFDEVHGSDSDRNLKGETKAAFLKERFGDFAYMGDSPADMPVWAAAAEAITVDAGPKLRGEVDTRFAATRHIGQPAGLKPYLKALRPHQWAKNVLVFLPAIAAHAGGWGIWGAALAAFVAFSLVASSAYLINDLLDLDADRRHPRKKARPMASGALPVIHGSLMAPGVFLAGLLVALIFTPPGFVALLLGYFVLTMAYSLSLKRKLIVDICTLAGLYTIRILGGGIASGLAISPWFAAFSIFFFLSLAAVKRQAELVAGAAAGKAQSAGRAYRTDDLPVVTMMGLAAAYVSVLVMALYLSTDQVQALYSQPLWLLGICLILIYWLSRAVMLAHRGEMDDDPVVFALKDRVSQISGLMVLGVGLLAMLG